MSINHRGEKFSGYNKPKKTPGHPKKSHAVLAKEGRHSSGFYNNYGELVMPKGVGYGNAKKASKKTAPPMKKKAMMKKKKGKK